MPRHNLLSTKVTLQEAVKAGQAVNLMGQLASTSDPAKLPAGIAQYDGAIGEDVAITVVGFEDVKVTVDSGLALGKGVKAASGNAIAAVVGDAQFGVVTAINGSVAEIMIGTGVIGITTTKPV